MISSSACRCRIGHHFTFINLGPRQILWSVPDKYSNVYYAAILGGSDHRDTLAQHNIVIQSAQSLELTCCLYCREDNFISLVKNKYPVVG